MVRTHTGYRHEALFYAGPDDFVAQLVPFIAGGLSAGEPVLVAARSTQLARLRDGLGADADRLGMLDICGAGRNPARVIPAWQEFVDQHGASGRRLRGIGEPIWPSRTTDELVECQRHEALLNLAVAADAPLWLVCPYDVSALPLAVIDEARENHPFVTEAGTSAASALFRLPDPAVPFSPELPPAAADADLFAFDVESLSALRRFVAARARAFGLAGERTSDLMLAINELATNSVRHGGGVGVVRMWLDGCAVVAEVRDRGCIDDPFAGRHRPAVGALGGRGLWLVNQLCDLVQVRSSADGCVVRIRLRRAP